VLRLQDGSLGRPLHETAIPRMYGRLTANTPGCVAFSLPCGAGAFDLRRFLRFSSLSRSQRSARPARRDGLEPERRPIPGHSCSRDGEAIQPDIRTPAGTECDPRRALRRHTLPSATNKAAFSVAIVFQTGRRLMRQTVLPTKIQGKSASTRNDSPARRFIPRTSGSARRPRLHFGLPLTPESGGPSRPPTARSALSVPRARRRQEFQNAQQNVDRRHPPGRDPGCRGPRQSRRRI